MVTAQFLGKIDQNSLLVQDDYIFVKVNATEGENERGVVLELLLLFCYSEILETSVFMVILQRHSLISKDVMTESFEMTQYESTDLI